MPFDGSTYDREIDGARLKGQLARVWGVMFDCGWYTLAEIRSAAGSVDSEAAVSARIRDFRKDKFGSFVVESRRRQGADAGLWEYSIRPPAAPVEPTPPAPAPTQTTLF